jgi:hypothetical protein
MTMSTTISESADVLRRVIGHRIVALGRDEPRPVGSLAIELDSGLILGVASDMKRNSVVVWIRQDMPAPAADFADPIWLDFIGATVTKITMLVRRPINVLFERLPNEVGLCFEMSSGAQFVATHGLHNDTGDFAVIPRQAILDRLLPDLREVVIASAGA